MINTAIFKLRMTNPFLNENRENGMHPISKSMREREREREREKSDRRSESDRRTAKVTREAEMTIRDVARWHGT